MFASVITKIYLALSGFKSNIKSLPGNPEAFEDDKVTAIRIHVHEIATLLNNISSLFESGLDEQDIETTIHTVESLPINHSERLNYNVFYNGELIGLSVIVTMDEPSIAILYFITEESLANAIHNIIEFLRLPDNEGLH